MELQGFTIERPLVETDRTRVFRGRSDSGRAVIVKTPTSPNPSIREIARYHRAFELGRRVDSRAVVEHLDLQRHLASVALITEDWGAQALSGLVTPGGLPLPHWLDLAIQLATALSHLHGSGVLHKDINPSNVLVDASGTQVRLIDLGAASALQQEISDSRALTEIEGTLAYMAPEQCGRTASMVDGRADLYSLGVTLFELACGHPPFDGADPQSLAHAHVARPAPRIDSIRTGFPAPLADIVATLLEKDPSDRYATAPGLAHDLEHAHESLDQTGHIAAFPLKRADHTASFRIPERLYGRKTDRERLLAALDEPRGLFVRIEGVSGIGKTALVDRVRRQILMRGGAFCSGKFDAYRSDIPYLGVLQALRELVRAALTQPESVLESLRTALDGTLGKLGGLLTEGVPELEAIIGPQPPVDDVPHLDAERRFHRIVARFLGVFAGPDTPLVVFVDDLQWADAPTLALLESLRENPEADAIVLVTGHRSNEVGPGHPAAGALERIEEAATSTLVVPLAPLDPDAVHALVADTLHGDVDQDTATRSLSARIHAISGGNPFFVRELLTGLNARGFFEYVPAEGRWRWAEDALHTAVIPDNLTELLTARLSGLDADTLDLLDTASCVGGEFDLDTLASVHGMGVIGVATRLAPAVAAHLVVPLDLGFKVLESLAALDVDGGVSPDTPELDELSGVRYRFQHDRVRQTVHERLDEHSRAERHVTIGRLLRTRLDAEELKRRQVDVFTHLLFGLDHIDDPQERRELVDLGLSAGQRALRSLAFDIAHRLLEGAVTLLPDDPWSEAYEATLALHTSLAECAHARGDYERFQQEADAVVSNARSPLDAARVHGLELRVKSTQSEYAQAVTIGVEVAASLGVSLPRSPGLPSVLLGVARTLWAQGRTDALEFADLPEATDPEISEAIAVLVQTASAAYFAEPNLLPLIGMTATRLSLKHGVTPASPYGFAVWALVLCGVLGRIENGGRFGDLALQVGRRYGGVDEARARFVVDTFVRHWREPLPDCAHHLLQAWAANRDAGDEESATYSAGVMLYTHFFAGGPLDAHDKFGEPIAFLRDCNTPHVKDCFLAWAQLTESLALPVLPDELSGRWYDHPRKLPRFIETDNGVQIAISSVAAGVLDLFADRFERADERFSLALAHEEKVVGQVIVPAVVFLHALTRFRLVLADPRRTDLLRSTRGALRRLRRWAVHAPFNLAHRVALLEAWDHLVRGRLDAAIAGFHHAHDCTPNGAWFYSALAHRGLSAALHRAGRAKPAAEARLRAEDDLARWGCVALAESMWESSGNSWKSTSRSSGVNVDQMDLHSLLASVAELSTQTDEDALLSTLMKTVCQASGADRGVLLLAPESDAPLDVDAEWTAVSPELDRTPSSPDAFVRGAVEMVRRMGETLVVPDASKDPLLSSDPYVQQHQIRSLLVAPMVVQGRTLGWLCLENRVARGSFTPSRVDLIEALGAQAAITLENARLYRGMEQALETQVQLTAANRRFVPEGFLSGLGCESIIDVRLNEAVEREISVLFVDLRGFSAIAMQLGPTGTVRMINRYLSYVQPSIVAEGGFVGQYYGDGVLALFPGVADSSIRAAVSMCRGLEAYNRDRGDLPELRFGMGLHTGKVTLGTIGDPHHFQCSVVGDSVNLASRMEGLCKHYVATLVLSGSTHDRIAAPDPLAIRPLGRVQVVGRSEVLDVYDCLDCYGDAQRDRMLPHLSRFAEGVAAYTAGEWGAALEAFDDFSARCPDDAVSAAFVQRCRERLASPAAWSGWDGVERPSKGKD